MLFQKRIFCQNIEDAREKLYQVIGEVIALGISVSNNHCVYSEFPEEKDSNVKLTDFRMSVFVPVKMNTLHSNFVMIPEQSAIAVCHRGTYLDIGQAYQAIWDYVKEHRLTVAGAIREYYLDSRLEYENEHDRYVTRIILPVK